MLCVNRAEDWNLAQPLQTCRLLVERRGDVLVLEFTTAETGALFCQSSIDLRASTGSAGDIVREPQRQLEQWVEPAVDTSRYFAVKIQGVGGREALVGFGFRERDQATDFRESIQYYERAMRREREAATRQHQQQGNNNDNAVDGTSKTSGTTSIGRSSDGGSGFRIPQLAEGEKIHVNRGGKSTITHNKSGSGTSGVPLLKKKPPPASSSSSAGDAPPLTPPAAAIPKAKAQAPSAAMMQKMNFSMGNINLDANRLDGDDSNDPTDSSGGAVYEGDDEQWATEFASA